jgi:dephospho-CoA kinase
MSRLVGLTGGIACGKSAVSNQLRDRGALIIDADQIAREVLAPNSEGLARVVARWGDEILDTEGALDRTRLGALVFGKPEERRELEAITHPLIATLSAQRISEAIAQEPPLVVYDAALLIEAGRADQFRPLVVVTTTSVIQRDRLMARDGLTLEDAQARVDAQLPIAHKEQLADHLITNDGDWSALERQVDVLWSTLVS